jgi:hypothetical protein
MKRVLSALVAASVLCGFAASDVYALPANSAGLGGVVEAAPLVEKARLYCFNKYTGRFLHWGPCGGGGYYRRPGRRYCYNRYTGRFLHWGSCY